MSTVARVESVTERYGKTSALSDFSLDIPAQCMAGLIGPDGVGKSTLLALISGVRKIQTGEVMVLDGSMADENHRRASYGRIAYMPQGLGKNLYADLSARENLILAGQEHRGSRLGRLFGARDAGLGAEADRIQAEGTLALSEAAYYRIIGSEPGEITLPELSSAIWLTWPSCARFHGWTTE